MLQWLRKGKGHWPQENLSAFVDAQLGAAKASQLTAHLLACVSCRRQVEDMRALKASLAALPRVEPTRSFTLSAAQIRDTRGLAVNPPQPKRLLLAPALSLSLLVALLAVDMADVSTTGRSDSGATAGVSLSAAQEKQSDAAVPSLEGGAATTASPPAAGAAASSRATEAPGDANTVGQAVENGDGLSLLTILEVLAGAALAISLAVTFGPRLRNLRH